MYMCLALQTKPPNITDISQLNIMDRQIARSPVTERIKFEKLFHGQQGGHD